MSDFDPKAYLAKKEAATKAPAFDPKAYLKKKDPGLLDYVNHMKGGIHDQLANPRDALGMLVRTFGQGVGGLTDEASGVVGAADEAGRRTRQAAGLSQQDGDNVPVISEKKPLLTALLERYRMERDSTRADLQKGAEAFPKLSFGAELAGALTTPIPGGGKIKAGEKLLTALKAGGKMGTTTGAVFGAGHSEADLTRGEVPEFLAETGVNAGLGGVIGAGGGYLGLRAANRAQKGAADALAAQQKLADKGYNAARGAFGGESSSGNRTLTLLREILENPNATPEQKAAAQAFLDGPDGLALLRGVYDATIARAPEQLQKIGSARAGMLDAAAKRAPEAVADATDEYLSKSTLVEDVAPRAARYVGRAIPQYISRLLGGGDVGEVAGTIAGAQIGDPGTAIANLLRNARFRHSSGNTMNAGAMGAAKLTTAELQALADWLRKPKTPEAQ